MDVRIPAPGIPLTFGRIFADTVASRYRVGPLGHGWSHSWEYTVEVLGNGAAMVRGPGAANRFFAPENGGYAGLPGDQGVLTHDGSAFRLREPTGMVYQFRADGRLGYVEDRNANRVTCAYSGADLVSLTRSNGAQILIESGIDGRIQRVVDPMGPDPGDDRVTVFEYDPTGTYLTRVTAPGSRVTGYSYQTTGSAPRLHSLTAITHPDGQSQEFGYDEYGRITSSSVNGGLEPTRFAYDTVGNVTVTDANGVATVIRPGLDGQAGRLVVPGKREHGQSSL